MDILYVLCLLTLNYVAADALLRVGRSNTCPRITDFSGRVKYRRKGTRAVFRCQKKFTRYGSKFATCLDDGTWSDETPLCIKTGCVPLDPSQVNNLDMEIVNGALVKFTCLENYVLLGETQAYCDGKDWSAPLPRCAAPHELLECDFEEDFCGWTQDDSEEQDWVRNVGPTPTGNTGPKHDHTYGETGTGHYLFFETSSPTMTGHQASLLSPEYTASLSPICFDFWYHILGPDEAGHVGSLEVFVLDQSQFLDDTDIKPLFFIEGNHGNEWHRGEITIDKQDEPYQIAIVATRALSYISDIAVDDVRLYNCSKQTSSAPTTQTITTTIPLTTSTDKSTTTTTPTTKTTTIKPTTKLTTIKQTTKSPATVASKAVTTTVPALTTTNIYTTTTQSVTSSPSSVATKTMTSRQVMSSSTARTSSPNIGTTTQKSSSIETKMQTQTAVTEQPITTSTASTATQKLTTTSKPGTTLKSSAKTTTASTKPSSTMTIPTTVTYPSTTTPSRSTTVTARPTVSSTSLKSVTVKKSPATTESTIKSTTVISTESSMKSIRTSSQTSVLSKIPTTTAKPTVTATTLPSTREAPSTSSTARPSSITITESTVSSATNKKSTVASSNTKKGTVTPSTKSAKSTDIQTTIKGTPSKTTQVTKPTKRTNAITTKRSIASNTTKDNSISVSHGRSQHPEDDTLKPLMIGLCVGIVAGLIIIGVIAYVCVRRRKFYTSRYEDELKPITNSASIQSLNNGHYYQDEEYESES